MVTRNYRSLIEARWDRDQFICVGLDPEWSRIPASVKVSCDRPADPRSLESRAALEFCSRIVSATHDLACAYKPNAAFFEALGPDGAWALGRLIERINEIAPDVPVIYDAKRGDIGTTNVGYVAEAFDRLNADAITLHPYLGQEALQPFLDRADKGCIILCRTSNPGGGEFQDLTVEGRPLYQIIAERIANGWNRNVNCSLVVGATYPRELAAVREIVGDMPILIPGIGAQGGDLAATVAAGQDKAGRGIVISSSRGVIFASGGEDFAEAARYEVQRLHGAVNQHRMHI